MRLERPVIGVTPGFAGPSTSREFARWSGVLYCDEYYLRAIIQSGGIPVILPHTDEPALLEQIVERVDGLLFTGGEDVDPLRYAERADHPEYLLARERDRFEFHLLEAFLPTGKPILAICRGHQVVNVAMGGSLVQDLSAVMGSGHHVQAQPPPATVHDVKLIEDSRISRALRVRQLRVNSYHHQAIDRLAADLKAVAHSEEGLIEAVEHQSHPYLVGVQWHPERLCSDGLVHSRLFADFVQACENFTRDHIA